jgi:uncharacterized cupredoxin-like copper-binding protein
MVILTGAAMMMAGPSLAATTINVDMGDKGSSVPMATGLGHGMGGDMAKATMFIKLDQDHVAAGEITFVATNSSKDMVHEMIVAPLTSAAEILPYEGEENEVNEEKAGYLGEIEEVEAGKSGTMTLELKPGEYILYCNLPGHYMAGMWTILTVQ